MSYASRMLDSYDPSPWTVDTVRLASGDALGVWAEACGADALADLSHQNLCDMAVCAAHCASHADVHIAITGVLSRVTPGNARVPGRWSGYAWPKAAHADKGANWHTRMRQHCAVCAEACRGCERACRAPAGVLE